MAIENIVNSVRNEGLNTVNNPSNVNLNKINNTVEEWIEDYQEENSNANLEQATIEEAFASIRNYISANAYDAASGNWLNISDKNVQYWTDNPLRFTKHEKTGSYLIEQQDENGNWIAMGYTDEATAAIYLKKIETLTKPETAQSNQPASETLKPKTSLNELSMQEAMEFSKTLPHENVRNTNFDHKTAPGYNQLSPEAKEIVDRIESANSQTNATNNSSQIEPTPTTQEGFTSLQDTLDTLPKPGNYENINLSETLGNIPKIDNF